MEPQPMKWTYDLATGQFLCGGPFDPPCDLATQGVERYDANPDPRTERWDGTAPTKKRAATAQEVAAYDAAQADTRATDALTDKKLLAVADYYRQQLNVVRAGLPSPLSPITRQTALDAIKTIWKAL